MFHLDAICRVRPSHEAAACTRHFNTVHLLLLLHISYSSIVPIWGKLHNILKLLISDDTVKFFQANSIQKLDGVMLRIGSIYIAGIHDSFTSIHYMVTTAWTLDKWTWSTKSSKDYKVCKKSSHMVFNPFST